MDSRRYVTNQYVINQHSSLRTRAAVATFERDEDILSNSESVLILAALCTLVVSILSMTFL